MSLKAHEKDALTFQLAALLDYDEPFAILATLQRIAERMAFSVTRGAIDEDAAQQWQALANALKSARAELERNTVF